MSDDEDKQLIDEISKCVSEKLVRIINSKCYNVELAELKSTIDYIVVAFLNIENDYNNQIESFKKDKLTLNQLEAEGGLRAILILKEEILKDENNFKIEYEKTKQV